MRLIDLIKNIKYKRTYMLIINNDKIIIWSGTLGELFTSVFLDKYMNYELNDVSFDKFGNYYIRIE